MSNLSRRSLVASLCRPLNSARYSSANELLRSYLSVGKHRKIKAPTGTNNLAAQS